MLVLGLGTSLHCVSMCGPLVLTYAVKGEEGGPWYRKITPNIAYQGAKAVSYMTVGLALGAVGSLINLNAVRPYVMYLAGAFMIVLGLGMTGRVKWAAKLTPRPPKWIMGVLGKLRRKSNEDAAAGESSLATPITFGLMTGLLPCGPLMAAQVAAAASGSPISGALGMFAFALGTAPLMVAFGTAGSLIPVAWKHRLMTVLSVGVMIFGLVFINRGLMLTGAPVNFNTVKTVFVGGATADTATYKTGTDGVVEVPLIIEGGKFNPQSLSIPADKPVRIVVDRREDNSCSDQVALPQLGILKDVAPFAKTTIDVPATKGGTYTLTCGMGMMSGQLVVGGGASSGPRPLPWLILAAIGTGAAYVVARKRDARVADEAAKAAAKEKPGKTGSKTGSKTGGSAAYGKDADARVRAELLFGFTATELVLVAFAVITALVAGLAMGGMFR